MARRGGVGEQCDDTVRAVFPGRQGTVDKYMGDCIMVFWNAPLDDRDHARHSCLSALVMQEGMGPLNDQLATKAKRDGREHIRLRVGIGVNTGEVVVGNMGSSQRFDYSVLSDEVNLAGLYDLYETRMASYETAPPDPDWEGVFVAEMK